MLFNQSNFDWILISQDKFFEFFLFNLLGGLIYFFLIYLFLKSSYQIFYIPIYLAFSYFIPGWLFIRKNIIVSYYKISIKRILNLIFLSSRYLLFNVLERFYSMAIFIFASWYITYNVLGDFRISHIFYGFISSIAVFLGMSLFNNAHKYSNINKKFNLINELNVLIILCFFPLFFLSNKIILFILTTFTGKIYLSAFPVLSILPRFLIVPAIVNFSRQIIIATSKNILSTISYAVTILSCLLFIIFFKNLDALRLLYILFFSDLIGILVFLPVYIFFGFFNFKKFIKYFIFALFFWFFVKFTILNFPFESLLLRTLIYFIILTSYFFITIYWFKKTINEKK